MADSVPIHVLRRAVDIVGGIGPLSKALSVPEHRLRVFLSAEAGIPESVFLAAVDIVLHDDIARASRDRRKRPCLEPSDIPWLAEQLRAMR